MKYFCPNCQGHFPNENCPKCREILRVMKMKIKMSEMTGKLKNIQAINTNPLSNEFCKAMHGSKDNSIICTECYSCSMLTKYRKNCVPAFERNSVALTDIDLSNDDLPKIKTDIVRIHAHGELINDIHLINLLRIVNKYEDKTFSLYTKRKDIIESVFGKISKPENLILVYSNPKIDIPLIDIPKHFDKVFNVLRNPNHLTINCGGKCCNTCRNCYNKNKENIIYEMIK